MVMAELSQSFKPEFLNRVDESVVFHPLLAEQIQQIAAIQINELAKRLAERDILFSATPEALAFLSSTGFDPLYGARPLKRTIQNLIENPLAQHILSANFIAGDSINVTVYNDELEFEKH